MHGDLRRTEYVCANIHPFKDLYMPSAKGPRHTDIITEKCPFKDLVGLTTLTQDSAYQSGL